MNALHGRGMCVGSRPVDALLMRLRFCCTMGIGRTTCQGYGHGLAERSAEWAMDNA